MLVDLKSLSVAQYQGTQSTIYYLIWFLNYTATHPYAMIRFYASEMFFTNHSDTSYLSDTKARIQSRGHSYLGNKITNQTLLQNGYILSLCKVL